MEEPEAIYTSPAHLVQETWVDFEHRAALDLLVAMESELKKLKLRVTADRVHKSRVSLRRWYSVWAFLAEDGWEEKKFKKKVLNPLHDFSKELGDLRDCDVNIQTALKLECDSSTIDGLKQTRKKLKRCLEKSVAEIEPVMIAAEIEKYLEHKALELKSGIKAAPLEDHSAFAHFDSYLCQHEDQVKKLAQKASSPESLHRLRLSIKKWRYLLTECMGLTTLELVRTQTLLGEIHDFDRLEPLLDYEPSGALTRLHLERALLEKDFDELKQDLPFGLRPGTISMFRRPDPMLR